MARQVGNLPPQGIEVPYTTISLAIAPAALREQQGETSRFVRAAMNKRLRFVMVGGFLGAGKTTALARLARFYAGRGQRVGLVTNDQAADLVDTTSLRSQGFAVEEVAGACFCCRFDDLVDRVGRLQEGERPDVILAEPVGSCTDLVATVLQPLKNVYGQDFA